MVAIHFLGVGEFADRINVTRNTLNKYRLPKPDAYIGDIRGWTTETIDAWQANRPGQGSKTNKDWYQV